MFLLKTSRMRQSQIAAKMDTSDANISPKLTALSSEGIISEDGGYYSISRFGSKVLGIVPLVSSLKDNKEYMMNHMLGDPFCDMMGDLDTFSWSRLELIKGQYRGEELWLDICRHATQEVFSIKSEVSMNMIGVVADAVYNGIKYTYMLSRDASLPKERCKLLKNVQWEDKINRGRIVRRLVDKAPIVVVMNEKEAAVCFPNLNGQADLTTTFYGDDPTFYQWCKNYFQHKWRTAKEFNDPRLMCR